MFVSEGSRIFEELFEVIVYGRITKMQPRFKLWEENIGPAFTAVVAGIYDLAVNRMFKGKRTRIFAFGVCSFGECYSVIPFRTRNFVRLFNATAPKRKQYTHEEQIFRA
jgi:hypothetical protein